MVLDVMLPDGCHATWRPASERSNHLPHRSRCHRGQGPRPESRSRRLHHQALQPRGAHREDSYHSAANGAGHAGVGPSRVRGLGAGRGVTSGDPSRCAHVWNYDFGDRRSRASGACDVVAEPFTGGHLLDLAVAASGAIAVEILKPSNPTTPAASPLRMHCAAGARLPEESEHHEH